MEKQIDNRKKPYYELSEIGLLNQISLLNNLINLVESLFDKFQSEYFKSTSIALECRNKIDFWEQNIDLVSHSELAELEVKYQLLLSSFKEYIAKVYIEYLPLIQLCYLEYGITNRELFFPKKDIIKIFELGLDVSQLVNMNSSLEIYSEIKNVNFQSPPTLPNLAH